MSADAQERQLVTAGRIFGAFAGLYRHDFSSFSSADGVGFDLLTDNGWTLQRPDRLCICYRYA